jgi:hypothetical protein
MNKLKAFAVTALTAATVGVGALAAAPSASAARDCTYYSGKAIAYGDTATILYYLGNYSLGDKYVGKSEAYSEMFRHCVSYL